MHQVSYLVQHGDPQVASATWHVFQPAFPLAGESVVFALGAGVAIWLLFLALWHVVAIGMDSFAPRPRRRGRT